MEPRAFATATGIFVLVLGGLLIAGALWLGSATASGVPYDLTTRESVAGLTPGASVRLRGVEIGQVERIGFDPHDPRVVRVRTLLDPRVRLMAGTYATLSSLGLAGTPYVELNYPDSASQTLESSAASPAEIPMHPSGLAELTVSGDQFLHTFTDTLQRVNGVLTPETSQHLKHLLLQIDAAAAQTVQIERDLTPVTHRLDTLLDNANTVITSTHSTIRDADSLIVDTRARIGALDAISEGAHDTGTAALEVQRAVVMETLPRIDALAEQLSRNSDTLDQVLHRIEDQPQSLIFGLPPSSPGPGEPGFHTTQR
jgi:phospholipid/cholesterol/gamma-HCH transport system substrate-binding protein